MEPWKIISQIEATSSRTNKEKILESVFLYTPEDEQFWLGCRFALDPLVTFGVKQIPAHSGNQPPADSNISWDDFETLCWQLQYRMITGSQARDRVQNFANLCTPEQWNYWYRRILIKDLRCGISEKTVNKVAPNTVSVFGCQLASDSANHAGKMQGEKLLDFKLDGVRVIAVFINGDVTLYSRNGRVFKNFPHIENALTEALAPLNSVNLGLVLDGEITSSNFQTLMTQVHRKHNVSVNDSVFNIFDQINYQDFLCGVSSTTQLQRRKDLETLYNRYLTDLPQISLLPYNSVNLNTAIGQQNLQSMCDQAAELGLEGVMVKDASAAYECKRNTNWLKIKPNIEVTLAVVDLEPGTGKNAGKLGALICRGEDDGRVIEVNVGSGLSDSQRSQFWAMGKQLHGMMVEIRADAITKNQNGGYSLRFPRFKCFRGWEPGEKI